MAIKFDEPKEIEFIYEDENDLFLMIYNGKDKTISIFEPRENEEWNKEGYVFPIECFVETIDFLRMKNLIESKNVVTNNFVESSVLQSLPLPNIKKKDFQELVKSEERENKKLKNNTLNVIEEGVIVNIAKTNPLQGFSSDTFFEKKIEKNENVENKNTTIQNVELQEEIIKRPVIGGNVSIEESNLIRRKGKVEKEKIIKRI